MTPNDQRFNVSTVRAAQFPPRPTEVSEQNDWYNSTLRQIFSTNLWDQKGPKKFHNPDGFLTVYISRF